MEILDNGGSRRQSESTPQMQSDSARRAADLYVHMTRIFGQAWTSKYGEVDDGTWATAISTLSSRQVKLGLRHCLNNWTDSFPPTPGQFRKAVMENDRPEHRALDPARRIARQPAEDHVRDEHMASIKAALGMED